MVFSNQDGFRHLRAAFQGKFASKWRGCDLKQIGNAFKDLEDGFWEKNSSERIAGNSEVY